jgi:hypothetical protein
MDTLKIKQITEMLDKKHPADLLRATVTLTANVRKQIKDT